MTADILRWSVTVAQTMLVAAIACYTYRLIRGPRAQDRVGQHAAHLVPLPASAVPSTPWM